MGGSKKMSVNAYGTCMWQQMKIFILAGDFAEAKRTAGNMLDTLRRHLSHAHAHDVGISYAFAAVANSFIEEDPAYAIHALTHIRHCEQTPITLLALSAKWWALSMAHSQPES